MDEIKPLFTATASVTGGRNGHAAASDGSVSVDLSVPKAMGGPGKPNTTTPEHLFALSQFGPTTHHRRSFAPVHNILYGANLEDSTLTL